MLIQQQDSSPERYQLIPRTLIFVRREDKLLLLKGAPHKKLWANLYNGVGGHVERGEDILTAARRELMEETGLSAVDLLLCGTILIDTDQSPGICIFVLTGESHEDGVLTSPEGGLVWVKIDDLNDLELVEDLPALLPQVLSWQPGQPVFSAIYKTGPDGELQITFAN